MRIGIIGTGHIGGTLARHFVDAGDDEEAKRTVAELMDEIGFDAVDAGTLQRAGASTNREARRTRKACTPKRCARVSPSAR
jgi:predicted dinucleotide-binding enzyme